MSTQSFWTSASLRLSSRAKVALRTAMNQVTDFEPVACVTWVLDQVAGEGAHARRLGPGWGIGFHPRSQIPKEALTMIEEIPFAFDVQSVDRLNGGELDFVDGRFIVNRSNRD